MKISFDFDSTLSRKSVRRIARKLIQRGDEVHIVTSRFEDPMNWADPIIRNKGNRDLYNVAKYLGIPKNRIHFLNMQCKSQFFIENPDFMVHLDDWDYEYEHINADTPVVCVLCDSGQNWKKSFCEITNLEEN